MPIKKLIASAIVLIFLLPNAISADNSCILDLKDETKGIHAVVETCKNIGTFSIGGLYNENWEKLTYFYPSPWEGTFLTITVNDNIYSNSANPDKKILMDPYVAGSSVAGNKISTKWMLPEKIFVEQILEITKDGVLIHVKTTNENANTADVGLRLHIDTMLGDNDGAPIYVPGDGLKTTEKEYSGSALNFKYWKAYNRQDDPTIIATGILGEKLTYPDKIIIANWKKSMHSSWTYEINPEVMITGDSAVILYYNEKPLTENSIREVTTIYGIGEPILPTLIPFGIADILAGRMAGSYCPNEVLELGIDIANNGRNPDSGLVKIKIEDKNKVVVYSGSKETGTVNPDSVQSIKFDWIIPENISGSLVVTAQLFKENPIDEKSLLLNVDPSQCIPEKKEINLLFLAILAVLILLILLILIYLQIGGVEIRKIREGDTVRVTVINKGRKEINNCIIEDRILGNEEIHVRTIGVQRIGDKLTMNAGRLKPGESATLEYTVKGINVLPRAKVRWDGGWKISL